jgi:hypothetical protein
VQFHRRFDPDGRLTDSTAERHILIVHAEPAAPPASLAAAVALRFFRIVEIAAGVWIGGLLLLRTIEGYRFF